MFGDTITLPLSTGNVVCTKIDGSQPYSCEYHNRSATEQYRVLIRYTAVKATATKPARDRHNVEITHTVFATESAAEIFRKTYLVIELSPTDSSFVLADGLSDWLIASTNANLTKLVNWES